MNDPMLIVSALTDRRVLSGLSMADWDLLVRQGRRANLLARLAYQLIQTGSIESIPEQPRLHLISALRMVQRQNTAMRWEVQCILDALRKIDVDIILLKGAAYVIAELPAAHGRAFSDIDILVPKHRMAEVESQLMLNGWQGTHHDDYDQRYYRQWMHEIPPLRHIKRGTIIDVHHTILPESARVKVNTPLLFENMERLPGYKRLFRLCSEDMLLHSATHLFHEGSLENGLRDLFDLDSLFKHFSSDDFWNRLVPRAVELGLTRPLYYAIRYCAAVIGTPIPTEAISAVQIGKPPAVVSRFMDECYLRALRPVHGSCTTAGSGLARSVLYVRSHWMRMPLPLLVCHLSRKAFRNTVQPSWDAAFSRDSN